MKYIIMCGGTYQDWEKPRQLTEIKGEPIVARTIRLLRENGINDIAISSENPAFETLGVPVLKHNNGFVEKAHNITAGYWVSAFYPTEEPACYLFGDVVFSEEAIRKIIETETDDIEFFASSPPFCKAYTKQWAEPFAFKVVNQNHLRASIDRVVELHKLHRFKRHPIAWELWQVIKGTPLNTINYRNYTAINDYTCDIDYPEDVAVMESVMP